MVLSSKSYTFTDVDHDGVYTSAGDGRLRGSNDSYAFDNLSKDLSFNGTLQLDFNPLVLRLSGAYNTDTYSSAGLPIQSMFNTRRHETELKNSLIKIGRAHV